MLRKCYLQAQKRDFQSLFFNSRLCNTITLAFVFTMLRISRSLARQSEPLLNCSQVILVRFEMQHFMQSNILAAIRAWHIDIFEQTMSRARIRMFWYTEGVRKMLSLLRISSAVACNLISLSLLYQEMCLWSRSNLQLCLSIDLVNITGVKKDASIPNKRSRAPCKPPKSDANAKMLQTQRVAIFYSLKSSN